VLLFTSSFKEKARNFERKNVALHVFVCLLVFGILVGENRRKMQAEEGKGNGEHLLVISL
jgi:hypothetical protein